MKILVVGGSLGAQALNDLMPQALKIIPIESRPIIVHQAGVKHIEALKAKYQKHRVSADCRAFIENMAEAYAQADFVVCRAGAMTIAELSTVGLGSLLIPFPFAVDDHQTTNAQYLAEKDAALLIQQKALTVEKLSQVLLQLTRKKCLEMAEQARLLGKPDATKNVAKICMEVAL
jgi:UDP-N-acetylglucosamine--N-acetylmuramyl-(pentapeptide) pyrophosphoryl-undecaprenol N-acetylglucosamine transferase